jgi:hypothetical protein
MAEEAEDLTTQDFLAAPDLAALREQFDDVPTMTAVWHGLAREIIERDSKKLREHIPHKLDYLEVTKRGVRYRVYGVIHGWTGGVSAEYRELVHRSLKSEKQVVYEKMLGRFYGEKNSVETPDFCVLRRTGQFVLGLRMMLVWPAFLLLALREIIKEIFTKRHYAVEDNDYNNIYYHNIDRELRRGLDGSLPTRLQIEYEMDNWRGWRGFWDMDLLLRVVPRSAYLAEFAQQWAAEKGVKEMAIVVGDRHLTEVRQFLENTVNDHWIIRQAQTHARQIGRNRLFYHWHFMLYLLTTTLGSFLGALPWLAGIFWLMEYLRDYIASGRAPFWLKLFFG